MKLVYLYSQDTRQVIARGTSDAMTAAKRLLGGVPYRELPPTPFDWLGGGDADDPESHSLRIYDYHAQSDDVSLPDVDLSKILVSITP